MRNIHIPALGKYLSCIALGTADFGSGVARKEAFALMDRYAAAGGNVLDTAWAYGHWADRPGSNSERVVGEWLKDSGQEMFIITKGAHPSPDGTQPARLSSRDIERDLLESMQRLPRIDLYLLHRDDPARPVEDILDTLERLMNTGYFAAYGCSNWHPVRIDKAIRIAKRKGYKGFAANELLYNAMTVDPAKLGDLVCMQDESWRLHERDNLLALAYASQAGGYITRLAGGLLDKGQMARYRLYHTAENQRRVVAIAALAHQLGVSPTAVALALLYNQPFPCIPIVGCRTLAQLEDSIASAGLILPQNQVRSILHLMPSCD